MLVTVFSAQRAKPERFASRFALKLDNWNDFGFQTLYHLYYKPHDNEQDSTLIGGVKILKKGQTGSDTQQITSDFQHLGDEFCSLGQSLDYYERLNSLPETDRNEILSALRDIVALPDIRDNFDEEQGWETSLFRDMPLDGSYLEDAGATTARRCASRGRMFRRGTGIRRGLKRFARAAPRLSPPGA